MKGIRLYTTHKHALLLIVIMGALVAFLTASPLPSVSYLGIGPVVLPIVLLFSATLAGILPTLAGLLLMLFGAFRVFGLEGLWFALYLAPLVIAFLLCLEREVPFFKTAGILLITLVFSMAFLFFFLQRAAGGALYSAAAKAAISGIDSLPYRDSFLYMLWKYGFLQSDFTQDAQAMIAAQNGGWAFKPEVVSEFYKQIDSRLVNLLSAYFPSLLTGFSLLLSLPVAGLAVKLGNRYQTAPSLSMPPFSTWYIPKALNPALLILAAGYLLSSLVRQVVFSTAGQLMYNVFSTVMMIQGLSLLNFILKRRGTRPVARFLLALILLVALPFAALFLGIFDQLADPRKLRVVKKPNDSNYTI